MGGRNPVPLLIAPGERNGTRLFAGARGIVTCLHSPLHNDAYGTSPEAHPAQLPPSLRAPYPLSPHLNGSRVNKIHGGAFEWRMRKEAPR